MLAAVLVVLAGVFSAADAALATYSRARAEELLGEGRAGSRRLVTLLDDRARYLNTALLLRMLCETSAVVLVTLEILRWYDGQRWATILTTVAIMLVVSFVVIGVAPRTLGRQHADRVAPTAATILTFATRILGPIPQAADPGRQRDHAGAWLPERTVLDGDRAARAGRLRRGLLGDRVGRAGR